jgi:hypothetical protein
MKIDSDIDLDLGDRDKLLSVIRHVPAAMRKVNPIRKHSSGVYITEIPYDPVHDMATIDYAEADSRGYFKLDLLNVHVYNQVRDEVHLVELMRDPDWSRLKDYKFVSQLIHLGNQFDSIRKMPEPIDSLPRLAMFLAVIRPAKRHLIGKSWKEISESVWDKDPTGYSFKRSHAVAYAQLVAVHMNIVSEQEQTNSM